MSTPEIILYDEFENGAFEVIDTCSGTNEVMKCNEKAIKYPTQPKEPCVAVHLLASTKHKITIHPMKLAHFVIVTYISGVK